MKFEKKTAGIIRKTYFWIIDFIIRNKILSLILLLAILFRFIGVYPGYHPYHSDEGMGYSSAIEMIRNLNLDPTRYDYPALVPIIHALLYVLFFIPLFIVKNLLFSPEDLPTKGRNLVELWQQVVIQNQQTDVLFWGRFITAAFGVGVVLLVYWVAKEFFEDRRIGLAAAFLTAVNFRQVLNSHLALPDIYNAFFLLLSLLFIINLLKKPTSFGYLVAGLGLGLYFSVKFQPYVAPVFLLVHLSIAWRKSGKNLSGFLLNFFSRRFFLACFTGAITILLLNPYHLIHFEAFKAINSYNVYKYGVGAKQLDFYPLWYLYKIGIGQLISVTILLGILVALRKYTFKSLVLLSFISIFFYLLVYYTRGGYYTRNFVTVTPLLLIFAGVFIVKFCEFLFRKKLTASTVIFLSALFISYGTLKNSIVNVYHFSKPWGFEEAHKWAQSNIPEKSTIVSHPWDKYPRDKELKVIPFEQNEIFSIAEMREDSADFAFLNMDWLMLSSYWWMRPLDWERFLKFRGRPDTVLANSYSAVASQELASFAVAKFVKPWQAPDMNFLIAKIHQFEEQKTENLDQLTSFSFGSEEEFNFWHMLSIPGESKKIIFDPDTGNAKFGSVKIEGGPARFPVVALLSPAIAINGKRAVLVEGLIRIPSALGKKERDGFLRVDFYRDEPQFNLEQERLYGSVSSRVFGEPGWHKKEIFVFPPEEAKFMTVGIQANNYGEFWFDDIVVSQSTEKLENPRKQAPYIDYRIPEDVLFPYSQGGL